jgi:hypothetical protein
MKPFLFLVPFVSGSLSGVLPEPTRLNTGGYKLNEKVYAYSPIDQAVLSGLPIELIQVGGVLCERDLQEYQRTNYYSLVRPLIFYINYFDSFSPKARRCLRRNAPLTFK